MNIERSRAEEKTIVERPEASREAVESIEDKIKDTREMPQAIMNDAEKKIDSGKNRAREATVSAGGGHEDVTNVLSALKPVQIEIQGTASEAAERIYQEGLSLDVYRLPGTMLAIESYTEDRNIDDQEAVQILLAKINSTLSDRSEGKSLVGAEGTSERELEDIKEERIAIRESLTYLIKEGGDASKALGKLTTHLYTERNIIEQEIDPSGLQETSDLEKEMGYLKSLLGEEGGIGRIPGEAMSSESKFAKNVFKSAVLFERGDLIGEIPIYNQHGEEESVEIGEIIARIEKGESVSLELSEEEKSSVKEEIDILQDIIDKKPAEGNKKKSLENKALNLTEILKVVSETQKKVIRLEEAWKENIASIKDSFEFTDEQLEDFKQKVEDKKAEFLRNELGELSSSEGPDIDEDRLIKSINREAQKIAA